MNNAKNLSRRTFVAAGAVAAGAAALGLSACGGGSKTSNTAAAGKAGGTLAAGCAYATTNFSPVGASSALGLPADLHVLEGLYNIDYSDYSFYKALAADDPKKISDTEYEVTLREGAKFSNGKAVTAADVVASFAQNMGDASTYKNFLAFIENVSAKDEKTVSFKLKYAMGSLLVNRLSLVLIFPADISTDDLKAAPIGSGPWMFDAVDGNDGGKVTFKPNPEYNGPKKPTAEAMTWDILKDATSRTTAMTEGTVMVMEDVPYANIDTVKAAGATVDPLEAYAMSFLMFNCIKKPFDDYRVRQAFFYAIDVEKLIKNQLAGNADAITSFLPKTNKNYNKAATVYTYDPEKAKALLKEAGQENLAVTVRVNDGWTKDLSAQIEQDLKAVGMDAKIDIVANTACYTDLSNDHSADNPLPFDVLLAPGNASCFGTDPDVLLSWWYDNDAWLKGRSCWGEATDGKSAEMREYMQQARVAASDADAQAAWNKAFDLLAEQVPLYPLIYKRLATAIDEKKIAGFKPVTTTGLYFLDASCK